MRPHRDPVVPAKRLISKGVWVGCSTDSFQIRDTLARRLGIEWLATWDRSSPKLDRRPFPEGTQFFCIDHKSPLVRIQKARLSENAKKQGFLVFFMAGKTAEWQDALRSAGVGQKTLEEVPSQGNRPIPVAVVTVAPGEAANESGDFTNHPRLVSSSSPLPVTEASPPSPAEEEALRRDPVAHKGLADDLVRRLLKAGSVVREARQARKLTADRLANHIGMKTAAGLCSFETRGVPISNEAASNIERALQLPKLTIPRAARRANAGLRAWMAVEPIPLPGAPAPPPAAPEPPPPDLARPASPVTAQLAEARPAFTEAPVPLHRRPEMLAAQVRLEGSSPPAAHPAPSGKYGGGDRGGFYFGGLGVEGGDSLEQFFKDLRITQERSMKLVERAIALGIDLEVSFTVAKDRPPRS